MEEPAYEPSITKTILCNITFKCYPNKIIATVIGKSLNSFNLISNNDTCKVSAIAKRRIPNTGDTVRYINTDYTATAAKSIYAGTFCLTLN